MPTITLRPLENDAAFSMDYELTLISLNDLAAVAG